MHVRISHAVRRGAARVHGVLRRPNPGKLQDILCAQFIWNALEDKTFKPNMKFFPYSFSSRDHKQSSLFGSMPAPLYFNCTLYGTGKA